MSKKRKKNLPKNGSNRKKTKETIAFEGETYMRMYDENGDVPEYLSVLNKDDVEGTVEELQGNGLMKVIEHNGVKYIRPLQ